MSFCIRLACLSTAIIAGLQEPAAAEAGASQDPQGVAQVTDVHLSRDKNVRVAGIGDEITVVVANLDVLTARGEPIRLYIDDRMVPGLDAEHGENRLYFVLLRKDDADAFWTNVFGRPGFGDTFFKIPARISVGVEATGPVEAEVGSSFHLRRVGKVQFVVAAAVFVMMAVVLCWLARNTNIVRDRAPEGLAELQEAKGCLGPYSLARVQMAVWFALVVGSFFFIWLVTGNDNTITNSVLRIRAKITP